MDRPVKNDQKDFFENLIRLIPLGIMLINADQEIEFHNRQFAALFGEENRNFPSLTGWLNTVFPKSDDFRQVRNILLYDNPGEPSEGKRSYTAFLTTKDGPEKLIELTSRRIADHRVLLTGEDVTEEKRRDAQLQHAQTMEAIESMAGGVAHEMNNILMGLQGYISLMMLDTPPSDSRHARLLAMENQIKNGSNLIDQLLERTREGRLELKTIELNELVQHVAASFGRTRREVPVREQYSAYLWAVEADASRLEQALRRVVNRAADLVPGQGLLRIQTDNIMLDESGVSGQSLKSGPYVRISLTVADATLDDREKLELFSPVSLHGNADAQTGSGLSLAYGILKAHQGLIDVESHPFTGTSFHLYLPASSKTPHKKKPESPPAKTRVGNETILLVDDEKVITDVTAAMLTALGYRVLTASDGEEAVAVYSEQGHTIDLVIMDVVMPGMGGGEAIDLIRAINPSVKVILCSGYSMDGAVKAIMDKGVQTFLKKPFNLAEFSVIIRKVLDG